MSAAVRDEPGETLPGLLVRGHRGEPCLAPLRHRSLLIGRHPGCPLRLNHPGVSMRHAIAFGFAEGVFLLDLDSRTGTRWDGESRPSGWLNGRGRVSIAPFTVEPALVPHTGSDPPDPTAALLGDPERVPDVELAFVDGPLAGTRYRLKRTITLIGRGPRCKVRLRDDADISRVHACLLLDEQGLTLIDTLSRRGMEVDGRPARHALLGEGRRLRIGKHLIEVVRCRLPEGADSTATALIEGLDWKDQPERALAQALSALRNVPDSRRDQPVDELLRAGRISPWQSRKLRNKDPARLVLDDRYLLLKPVARGGMSTVYRAFDLETGETVALKIPHTGAGDVERRFARFRREISISSALRHPHIVGVRDTGRNLRYLVFDFVRGEPLSRLISRRGALAPPLVIEWMSQVADALACAHGTGIIHRDIKPDNIMITETGSAMLLDLGLARLFEDDGNGDDAEGLTRIGFTVGTLDYMSPEQAAGTGELDGRADIYSLGCTMYAALAGDPPFRFENVADLARRLGESAPPPIPDLDPELSLLLARALSRRPEDRFQTPEELRDALQAWQGAALACT